VGTRNCPSTVRKLLLTHSHLILQHVMPVKMSYEAAKKWTEPYSMIVGELPHMRRDTVQIVRQAVRSEGRRAYMLVNNRAEGNAPLTVQALTDQLRTRN
jgi:hypothetical protein